MYRIKWKQSLGVEMRSIAMEKLSSATHALKVQDRGVDHAIHETRKAIKHVRALYRLVRACDPDALKPENDRLRAIANSLGSLRDRAATLEAIDKVHAHIPDPVLLAFRDRLAARAAPDENAAEAATAQARMDLHDAIARIETLRLPDSRRKAASCIAEGWRKTTKRAIDARELSRAAHGEEDYHTLRKRGQDRWMQAALLRKLWPAGLTALQTDTKRMVDLLGQSRDLAMLEAHLQAEQSDSARLALIAIFESERRSLQEKALALADAVFDPRAKKEADIIRLLIINAG